MKSEAKKKLRDKTVGAVCYCVLVGLLVERCFTQNETRRERTAKKFLLKGQSHRGSRKPDLSLPQTPEICLVRRCLPRTSQGSDVDGSRAFGASSCDSGSKFSAPHVSSVITNIPDM